MASGWRIAGLVLLVGSIALILWAPGQVSDVLHNALALSNLAILIFAVAVLAWFLYAVILRRILRARRIGNARMKRMMREAGERQDRTNR
jgi:drug/metabolite transporter (DMT)-like permease